MLGKQFFDLVTFQTQLNTALLNSLKGGEIPPTLLDKVGVIASKDLQFGDYQSNAAMMLAKMLQKNPRELAQEIIDKIEVDELAELSIAGPGFINFKLKPEAFETQLLELANDERCGVPEVDSKQTYVIDFSSPNVAKPMHVGHIRSTIIGDALSRISRFLGHEVITDNHIGDWGTQFGMVIWAWKQEVDEAALQQAPLQELLRLYRLASNTSKESEEVKSACRQELVKLQAADAENTAIWERAVELSKQGLQEIYTRLDVSFDHWLGESAYNAELAGTVQELLEAGIAAENEGAVCVFSGGTREKKKDPFMKRDADTKEWVDFPMIIQKSDGAYNYATTDLATLAYRRDNWSPDHVLYVVDHRQGAHFHQLFDIAERTNYPAELHHVAFGTICGKDGKPLKTRAGDLPQLDDVLNEAVEAAQKVIAEKSHLDTEEEKAALAENIGLASVKFTELSHNRMSDYNFDLDKMVALEGDTAPYLMYSYVRPQSIFRKLEEEFTLPASVTLTEPQEIHLARMLSRFGEVLPVVLEDYRPNLLTTYLLELARAFHSFFEACPVLKSEGEIQASRLTLCYTTAKTLKKGLSLLGIKAPEKM